MTFSSVWIRTNCAVYQCQPLIETVSGRSLTTTFTTNFPPSDSTNDAPLFPITGEQQWLKIQQKIAFFIHTISTAKIQI